MRPRANTISHIDTSSFMFMGQPRMNGVPTYGHGHHHSISDMPDFSHFDMRNPGFSQLAGPPHLPKIETSGLGLDIGGGLKTAPVTTFDVDRLFAASSGHTVNPAQLHSFGAHGTAPESPFTQSFPPLQTKLEDDDFDRVDWAQAPNMHETLMSGLADGIGGGSSPSASTGSVSAFSEMMADGSNHPIHNSGSMWANPLVVTSTQFANDPLSAAHFPELIQAGSPSTIAPNELHELHDKGNGPNFLSLNPTPLTSMSPLPGSSAISFGPFIQPHLAFASDTTSIGSTSANGSGQPSSITTASTGSVTDAGRQALLYTLSQAAGFGRTAVNYSQSSITPISPGYGPRQIPSVSLPNTTDLQRYVNSYVQYFHPHMPFLHIPTINFDPPAFTTNLHRHHSFGGGIVGGGGCLILAIAAIGASYEFEQNIAMELFEASKKMFSFYLEERRKAQTVAATGRHGSFLSPPLWLVQTMLLNLIFGFQCGDSRTVEIATTHCAALTSLAKSAGLFQKPDPVFVEEEIKHLQPPRTQEGEADYGDGSMRVPGHQEDREDYLQWYRWKCIEERKRTLFSVFILSSLLVIGYNQGPKILNSELQLDLPCDEELWSAETPAAWRALGGVMADQERALSCGAALEFLLKAGQRTPYPHRTPSHHQAFGSSVPLESLPTSDLKPSIFGCYVLINALHVYIWETRQRHQGQNWKAQETEQLYSHVEPALREWQAAWHSHPHHSLERPNPYGPLPADCIPLLDLAYVRLFVNLGRSKEAFSLRDFEGMAEELGSGAEIIQHADIIQDQDLDSQPMLTDDMIHMQLTDPFLVDIEMGGLSADPNAPGQTMKRERLLRKAAFYAADSLSMADKLGSTYAHFTSRELPMQAAMCTYDCTQVVAEWIATVQDRVGRHLGVLGREEADFSQISSFPLLEDEDRKLLGKVEEILTSYKMKMSIVAAQLGTNPNAMMAPAIGSGYGYRLLMATAYMLDKAAVWGSEYPVGVLGSQSTY
jgi:Fungal specific transcription factor domain